MLSHFYAIGNLSDLKVERFERKKQKKEDRKKKEN